MKWFRRLTILLLTCLSPFVLLFFFISSSSGLTTLVRIVDAFTPGALQVERVDGSMLDTLTLTSFSYTDQDISLAGEELLLNWRPTLLFQRQLHIVELRGRGIRYAQTAVGKNKAETAPFTLPDISLPVELFVDHLLIDRASITTDSNASPVKLNRIELSGKWLSNGITLEQLTFTLPELNMSVTGSLLPQSMYPADLQITAGLTRPGLPELFTKGRISGNLERYEISQNISGGFQAKLDGYVLDPLNNFSWRADLKGEGINPGLILPDWPGKLNIDCSGSGSLSKKGRDITVVLRDLSGELRQYPIKGTGEIVFDAGNVLRLKEIELYSGASGLKVNGQLADNWRLDWQVDIPNLIEVLPDGAGKIRGSGKLHGSKQAPVIEAALHGKGLSYQENKCQVVDVEVALHLQQGTKEKTTINIDAKGLHAGGQAIDAVKLDVNGLMGKHTVDLHVTHSLGNLDLKVNGGLALAAKQWKGTLEQIDLSGKSFGKWRLKENAKISAGTSAVSFSSLCLLRGGKTELCGALDWKPQAGKASIALRGFPLQELEMIPADRMAINGMVQGDLDITLGKQPLATLDLLLEPGDAHYRVDREHQIRLKHRGGSIHGVLDKKQLTVKSSLDVGKSGASAGFTIPRPSLEKDFGTAPVKGQLEFDLKALGLLTAFIPALQEVQGKLCGILRINGTLAEPLITGEADMKMAGATVPALGLELKDVHLLVKGDGNDQLDIAGELRSGLGQLNVEGTVILDADKGWPIRLTAKGQNIKAYDLPQAMILINPDITLQRRSGNMEIEGVVLIPEAKIKLRELPASARKVSSDIVIINNGDSEKEAKNEKEETRDKNSSNIKTRVTLVMGDKVKFRGYGLVSDLSGKLTLSQEPGRLLVANGDLGIENGTFRALGQQLTIERGKVYYAGGSIKKPGFIVRATRTINNVEVGVNVSGSMDNPEFDIFSSDPAISESTARSMLLTGADQSQGEAAKLYLERDLNDRVSVGAEVSVDGKQTEFISRYKINSRLNVETNSSTEKSGLGVTYTIELE